MTSNLGSQFAFEPDAKKRQEEYLNEVHRFFKPEFINRIDDIVVFNSLNEKTLGMITDKFLDQLATRLAERNIKLVITNKAKKQIMAEGYDEAYGARPLKRYIQHNIETQVAYKIIENAIEENATITVDYDGHDYQISTKSD